MIFWAVSSQLMKHGSTNTTLKRSGKVHNGRLPIPHDQKCTVSPNQASKQCCWIFYIRGIVHYEFVPTGQIVNQINYLEILERLREIVRRKWPEIFANNSRILHPDNAPAHTALSVREVLATKQITVLEHPAYSPDLAPSDFFLFLKLKEILKGMCFDDIDDIRSNTRTALKAFPQTQFQNCFEGWTRRWHRYIASQCQYFEGDNCGIQQWGM